MTSILKMFIKKNALLIFLILLIIGSSLISDTFFTTSNIFNIIKQISIIGILACGLTFCIIVGNIDLSFGAVTSMCAIIAIILQPINWIFAIFVSLIAGMIVGGLNGVIIGKFKANPIINN